MMVKNLQNAADFKLVDQISKQMNVNRELQSSIYHFIHL